MIMPTKGFRTYAVMTLVIILTVLEQLGTIDLRGLLIAIGVSENVATASPAIVAALAIVLRSVTTSPPGKVQ